MKGRSLRRLCIALALAFGRRSTASSFGLETSAGTTAATAGTTASTFVMERLSGAWDARPWLSLRLGVNVMDEPGTAPSAAPAAAAAPAGARFGTGNRAFYLFSLGGDIELGAHFTLSLDASGSPPSALQSDARIDLAPPGKHPARASTAPGSVEGQADTSGWSYGGRVGLTYETDRVGDWNAAIDLTAGLQEYGSASTFDEVVGSDGKTLTPLEAVNGCGAGNPCSAARKAAYETALQSSSMHVGQLRAGLGIIGTIRRDTDVGLSGAVFGYTSDPTRLGTAAGVHGALLDIGGSANLIPLLATARVDVAHRFGDWSASLWGQWSEYVSDEGWGLGAGLKLQYRIARFRSVRPKVYVMVAGQRDVDGSGTVQLGVSGGLGLRLSF